MINLSTRVKLQFNPHDVDAALFQPMKLVLAECAKEVDSAMLSLSPDAFADNDAFTKEYSSLSTQKQTITQLLTLIS